MSAEDGAHARIAELVPRVSSSALHDCLITVHRHPCTINDLVCPTPGRVLFGRAATIAFLPHRADLFAGREYDFARMYYAAVKDRARGAVLVMSSGGMPGQALAGGKKFSRAAFQGVAGALTDGRFRDLHELAELGLALYCSGESVAPANGILVPHAADVPVQVAGVTVVPGDYVLADQAGAVVVPASVAEDVFTRAADLERRDAATVEASRDEAADREANAPG